MATQIKYRFLTIHGWTWPLVAGTAVVALFPFAGRLNLAGTTQPVTQSNAATQGPARYTYEVEVADPSRGCRWQFADGGNVQIADCGGDQETVRVVIERDQVTEYRLKVRQATSGSGVTAASSAPASASTSHTTSTATRAAPVPASSMTLAELQREAAASKYPYRPIVQR